MSRMRHIKPSSLDASCLSNRRECSMPRGSEWPIAEKSCGSSRAGLSMRGAACRRVLTSQCILVVLFILKELSRDSLLAVKFESQILLNEIFMEIRKIVALEVVTHCYTFSAILLV